MCPVYLSLPPSCLGPAGPYVGLEDQHHEESQVRQAAVARVEGDRAASSLGLLTPRSSLQTRRAYRDPDDGLIRAESRAQAPRNCS